MRLATTGHSDLKQRVNDDLCTQGVYRRLWQGSEGFLEVKLKKPAGKDCYSPRRLTEPKYKNKTKP